MGTQIGCLGRIYRCTHLAWIRDLRWQTQAVWPHLQRLDRDLTELHHPPAMLQGDRSGGKQAIPIVDSLLPVEHHDKMPSLGGDLVRVPLAAGLGHGIHLDKIDDPTRAVGRVLALVVDVDLVTSPSADGLRIAAANKDPAVGVVARPKLNVELEVLVRRLADQVGGALTRSLVSDDRTVFEPPIALADPIPVAHILTVEQRHPSRSGLTECLGRDVKDGEGQGQKSRSKEAC